MCRCPRTAGCRWRWPRSTAGPGQAANCQVAVSVHALFLSPHKFVGGPQTPGLLVVRRELVRNRVPTAPGGGTVAFVDPLGHRYLDDPVAREEDGAPAIVESIRAGLVFALKQAVGTDTIQAAEERSWRRALAHWDRNPGIEIPGIHHARRLSIVSLRVRHGERAHLHHNYVVALLNDLFGIQARGGCSCAGARTATASSRSTPPPPTPCSTRSRTATRASSPAGPASTSTTSSATPSATTSSTPSTRSPRTATGC